MDERVEYYCKLTPNTTILPPDSETIGNHTLKNRKWNKKNRGIRYASPYFFDTQEHTRYFERNLKWKYCFGDVTYIPEVPAITKSRPLSNDNANSVIMKLDKNRYFVTIKDKVPFEKKCDLAIFRGLISGCKANRHALFERHLENERLDIGEVSNSAEVPDSWKKPLITLYKHLEYKFIFALEGNDVASNLKWVMSSNSVAIMPKPTCETWFMEGKLIAGKHYIEIAADYSDLNEKLKYYLERPEECKEIARNANEYVAQFQNKKREKLISLLVLKRYFEATSQTLSH
ncbi:MAG: glycosyl transferase family 90 [Rikenellaceae bacterium]